MILANSTSTPCNEDNSLGSLFSLAFALIATTLLSISQATAV
jgi:hypothetical protein